MYALAVRTASYRQDGISHQDMLGIIAKTVQGNLAPFSILKSSQPKYYKNCIAIRQEIRKSNLNLPDAIPEQSKIRYGIIVVE